MSLSNPRSASPVQRYFRLKGAAGAVAWYDKAASQEVTVSLPFKFIVLDTLNSIGGFDEKSNSGIFSNEVRSVRDESLTVRSKAGVLFQGTYDSIKDVAKAAGAKFNVSAYIAFDDNGQWALGNISFIGASLSEWFDFSKGKSLDVTPGVAITGFEPRVKGATKYSVPLFSQWNVSAADLSAASALDETLQAYLSSRGKSAEGPVEEAPRQSFGEQQSFGGFSESQEGFAGMKAPF